MESEQPGGLNAYVEDVRALCDAKGFSSAPERTWEMLALIHSEIAEATDSYKKGLPLEAVGEELTIDITHLSINIIKLRLKSIFGIESKKDYRVVGEPEDLASAMELANQNRYQFQWWATSLIDAKPYGDRKKGKDTGIDGFIFFMDKGNKVKSGIVSVKSGNVQPKDIRDLKGVLERDKAEIGIFITLQEPTGGMVTEALSAGFYKSQLSGRDYPRIQILTIEELLKGVKPKIPNQISPFKKAEPSEGIQFNLVDKEH